MVLKIERDKVYLTRAGKKLRILATDGAYHKAPMYPVVAISERGYISRHTTEGRAYLHAESTSDLVSEYVPPPPLAECWVNFYADAVGAHPTEQMARDKAQPRAALRIAVHMREVTKENV